MKNTKKLLRGALCLLLACTALSACSRANKFKYHEDGRYEDKKTGIIYSYAPLCYSPIAISEKKFGDMDKIELYQIEGTTSDKFLCDLSGTVFCAEGVTLPTLDKMTISETKILINSKNELSVSDEDTAALVAAYTSGESFDRPMSGVSMSVSIRFADHSLGLYYTITYMELSEDYILDGENLGRRFLFDRFEGRCVCVDALIDDYLEDFRDEL